MNDEILRELFPSIWEAQNKQAANAQKAAEILRQAVNDSDLMDSIQELPINKNMPECEDTKRTSTPQTAETTTPLYMRADGESLKEYLRRTHADLFYKGITEEGITEEERILEATRKAYTDMWEGSKVLCNGRYYNAPEVKRERERVLAVLAGA